MSESIPPAIHALQRFLEASFGDGELRALAFAALADEPTIFTSLPGTGASGRELAFHVVLRVSQHYPRPPAALWSYLHTTRARRSAEIDRLRAAFGPVEAETPVPAVVVGPVCARPESMTAVPVEVRSVLRAGSPRGSCDLLRCPRPGEPVAGAPFDMLCAGRTNGVARALALAWTDDALVVHATPTMYRGDARMPARIELPLPLQGEDSCTSRWAATTTRAPAPVRSHTTS